jgi:large subunit ribosomal protein L11
MVFRGLTVPVRIECDPETKQFEIFVETPSTASLLLKEAGVKKSIFLDKTMKNAVKSTLGTALSIGVTVEGEDPREIQKRIDNGEYNEKIKGEL